MCAILITMLQIGKLFKMCHFKSILPTVDLEQIKGILGRDNIYSTLVYDGSPSLQEYVPMGLWFQLLDGDMIAGLINLIPLNNVLWQPHIFIFEQYRGNKSEQWGKLVVNFMKENCEAKKFIAFTPYVDARRYAERVGFKCTGILNDSIQKNGMLLNQYMLELGVDE